MQTGLTTSEQGLPIFLSNMQSHAETQHYDVFWRLLQAMTVLSAENKVGGLKSAVDTYVLTSSILFGVFCGVVILAYVAIYHPLMLQTHSQLKSIRAMLFLIPPEVLANVPIFQAWLQKKKKEASQQF